MRDVPKKEKKITRTVKKLNARCPRQKSKQNASIRSIHCNRERPDTATSAQKPLRPGNNSKPRTSRLARPVGNLHCAFFRLLSLVKQSSGSWWAAFDGRLPTPLWIQQHLTTNFLQTKLKSISLQLSINLIVAVIALRRCHWRRMASGSVFLPSATWRARRNWLAHCMVIPGRILFELNYIMKLKRTAKVKSHPCVFCCGETGRVAVPAQRTPTHCTRCPTLGNCMSLLLECTILIEYEWKMYCLCVNTSSIFLNTHQILSFQVW